jgi:hypothetical protein
MLRTQAQEQVFEWTQSERLKLQTVFFPPPAPAPQPPTGTRDATHAAGDARETGVTHPRTHTHTHTHTPPLSSRSLISCSLSLPAYAERADIYGTERADICGAERADIYGAERADIHGAGVGAGNGARSYENSGNSASSGHGGHGGGGGGGDGGRARVRQGTGVIDMARDGGGGQGQGGVGGHVSRSRDLKAQIKALLS